MCIGQSLLVVALFVGLVKSWDIVLSAGDRLEFYTHDGIKSGTVRLGSHNATALAYNEVHNIVLYIDKWSDKDAICGYKMTSKKHECYIENNGRHIQSLAFDPVTELLFFTDTKEKSINWFSFKPGFKNNVFGNLLIKMDEGTPTDITVDICRGYIYWINTKLTMSTIERARFDGSEREVVLNTHELDLNSLTIFQQTQKMYWVMNNNEDLYRADLNGTNKELLDGGLYEYIPPFVYPSTITVSKGFLFYVDRCMSCGQKSVWKFTNPIRRNIRNYQFIFSISTENVVGIAANYKIKDQIHGISGCNQVSNKHEIKVYEGPFCDQGIKLYGQSLCKCIPGYTGVRCDVTVCENYCIQGSCSLNDEGLPKCRCNAGYSGDRCEVNECHRYCLNNGICSSNVKNEPVCQCRGGYSGDRCESSVCENYCFQGNCSINEEGLPICRCDAGYSGHRCEVNICQGYCLNNGICSLKEEDELVCECIGDFEGERCEFLVSLNNGNSSINKKNEPVCQCVESNEGSNHTADQNKTISIFNLEESERSRLTLNDLLVWHKQSHQ